MNSNQNKIKRLHLAYLATLLGAPFLPRSVQTADLAHFDVINYINISNYFQLTQMGLSEDKATFVFNFQNSILSHKFSDFEELRAFLQKKINNEYNSQQLAVYKSFILSYTELSLLVLNFKKALA